MAEASLKIKNRTVDRWRAVGSEIL